ncbi:stress-responsive family protein [Dorcoceras hygrometricum]|uniref:Stress-responsive family protein n=1 Tax=Dorcoceras hygrometricum TaxID=472368 RepID=A0A2Z7DFU2_9LAMI|nr:stress-responsive family protein [Dorcoceras hygrometricum]
METQMQRPDDAPQFAGESNQPGEKKSMIKKVKDKAKKLKHTIKKQGQGQGQEHEYRYDENVDDDDDDDDEEISNDREIHGASPTQKSTEISSTNVPPQLDQDLENQAETHGDRIDPLVKGEAKARPNMAAQTGFEQEKNAGETAGKFGPSTGLKEDPQAPKTGLGDALAPPPNYESKVPDPTGDGAKEAGVGGLISRFDNLNVGNEPETTPDTGSHAQFNPESTLDNPESVPKSFDSNESEGMPRDTNTITGKVSSGTSALTDKAISVKNVVASKLGYGGGSGQEGSSPSTKPESESAPGYTQKITETLNPVYEKVAGAGTAVLSKFQRGGDVGNQGGVTGQEGSSLSSKPESETAPSSKPEPESAPGYTQRITETLNPVYEKVAGAGTAVLSKFQGGGEAGNQGITDKGVSPKEYWSEKLKPGDEDKALSEAITDALHKKKEGYFQKPGEVKPAGKVTESEDVATHLGSAVEGGKREGEDALDAGRQSSGPGVVGRVKDAVGSWIGKGTGTQTAQDSVNESYVDHAGEQAKSEE